MLDMAEKTAEWRKKMNAAERRELERLEAAKGVAVGKLRDKTLLIKNRCIKRLIRARDKDVD